MTVLTTSKHTPLALRVVEFFKVLTVFVYITIFGLKMEKNKHETVFKRRETYKNLPSEEYLGNFSFLRRSKDMPNNALLSEVRTPITDLMQL